MGRLGHIKQILERHAEAIATVDPELARIINQSTAKAQQIAAIIGNANQIARLEQQNNYAQAVLNALSTESNISATRPNRSRTSMTCSHHCLRQKMNAPNKHIRRCS